MSRFFQHFAFTLAATIFVSCANLSTLQTARTVPVGTDRWSLGGGFYQSDSFDHAVSSVSEVGEAKNFKFPYLEVGYRYPVARYQDLGLRLTIPGAVAADFKWQFVDSSVWALAIGAGAGFLYVPSKWSSNPATGTATDDAKTIVDVMLPLIISADVSESVSVYVSPKYLLRIIAGIGEAHLGGGGLGLRFGKKTGVFLEANYSKAFSGGDYSTFQLSAAIYFGSAPVANYSIDSEGKLVKAVHRGKVTSFYRGRVGMSHPANRFWKQKDVVCFYRNQVELGCGVVVVVNQHRAEATLYSQRDRAGIGDEARLANPS